MIANLSAITSTINRVINSKRTDKAYDNHINQLKANINNAKQELHIAIENFNNVTEPRLIDFYIYKIQSEQTRYEQLLSEYKTFENTELNINME